MGFVSYIRSRWRDATDAPDEPGLYVDEHGAVYYRSPDGAEAELGGGGGALGPFPFSFADWEADLFPPEAIPGIRVAGVTIPAGTVVERPVVLVTEGFEPPDQTLTLAIEAFPNSVNVASVSAAESTMITPGLRFLAGITNFMSGSPSEGAYVEDEITDVWFGIGEEPTAGAGLLWLRVA